MRNTYFDVSINGWPPTYKSKTRCLNKEENLWYGKRKGKYVVVKKEVLPLDPDSDEPCSDDLSEIDLPK